MHYKIGTNGVRWGMRGGSGGYCGPALSGAQGRHKAGAYGELMGLAGRGLAGHFRIGTRHQYRHQVDKACCRRGGVAGAEPPHKGGPNRPDRTTAVVSGQWSVATLPCIGVDRGLAMVSLLPKVCESSPSFWDVPLSRGASQFWGGNSLAGNQCQRWLEWLTVFGRDAVQAPDLAERWSPSVGEGARAGTGPAPTGI